jgi:hypothetical protein
MKNVSQNCRSSSNRYYILTCIDTSNQILAVDEFGFLSITLSRALKYKIEGFRKRYFNSPIFNILYLSKNWTKIHVAQKVIIIIFNSKIIFTCRREVRSKLKKKSRYWQLLLCIQ